MRLPLSLPRVDWRCAVAGLILPASLLLAFMVASAVGSIIGGAPEERPQAPLVIWILIVLGGGGAVWGRTLARLTQAQPVGRLAFASALSFSGLMVLIVIVLSRLEERFVADGPSPLPLHNLYTVLFVPATFLGVALMGFAIGLALRDVGLARRLAWQGGSAAALVYLVCNVLQDVLGRRVGGPRASETATMITVTLVCYICAAMAMSAAFGKLLRRT